MGETGHDAGNPCDPENTCEFSIMVPDFLHHSRVHLYENLMQRFASSGHGSLLAFTPDDLVSSHRFHRMFIIRLDGRWIPYVTETFRLCITFRITNPNAELLRTEEGKAAPSSRSRELFQPIHHRGVTARFHPSPRDGHGIRDARPHMPQYAINSRTLRQEL